MFSIYADSVVKKTSNLQ